MVETILKKRFKNTMLRVGYDMDEVDDFLNEIIAYIEELESKLEKCD